MDVVIGPKKNRQNPTRREENQRLEGTLALHRHSAACLAEGLAQRFSDALQEVFNRQKAFPNPPADGCKHLPYRLKRLADGGFRNPARQIRVDEHANQQQRRHRHHPVVIGDKHDTREDEQRQCRPSGALPPACFCTVIHCAPSFVTR